MDSLVETLKLFNRLTLQSTINDFEDDHSNKNVAESNPKSYQLVATHTSDGKKIKITDTDTTKVNSPHKLLTNREIPDIIQVAILSFNQTTVDGVDTSERALHAVCAILRKEIVMGMTYSAAGVIKYHPVVNWKDASGPIPRDRNTARMPHRATTQFGLVLDPMSPQLA